MSQFDEVASEHRVPFTWMDGEVVASEDVRVPLMTNTLHYGLGVFEGIRSYEGAIGPAVFRLREHITRLLESAALLRIDVPFDLATLMKGCTDTLAANKLKAGYLRPIVFVADGKRGLSAMKNRIRVAIAVWPWGAYLGEEGLRRGITAQISNWRRMNAQSFLPKGKICGQYVNSILAKREAVLGGFDEAILLDDDANVAEASGENLFAVKDGKLYTPPTTANILAGITRASIIEIARSHGITVVEQSFPRSFLYFADEVFLCGTAAEVTPVRNIDNRSIGNGERGPITEKLQSAYFAIVRGENEAFHSWLTAYQAD